MKKPVDPVPLSREIPKYFFVLSNLLLTQLIHFTQEKLFFFRNLGTVEMEDQIAVTRKLVANYSFMDASRTAIWGWSYGGFATLMTLEQDVGPNPTFSCGISGG